MASRLESFFDEADADGNGELTYDQLAGTLRNNGYKYSDEEIKGHFSSVNFDGGEKIKKDVYMEGMGSLDLPIHAEAALRRVLALLDVDGDGVIDKDDLETVYDELKNHLTEEQQAHVQQMAEGYEEVKLNIEQFVQECFPRE